MRRVVTVAVLLLSIAPRASASTPVWVMGYYAAYEKDLLPVGEIPGAALARSAT